MKIVVGMATTNFRREWAERAMESLRDQVDEIRLYNNDTESEDYTDNAKFRYLSDYAEPIYFFSCDDDIFYPTNYIKKSIEAIETYNAIITYHGRKLLGLNRNYYRGHQGYRCLGTVEEDARIDVPGTGVTAFRTDYFNPIDAYKSKDKKMADCVIGLEAAKQNKDIYVINHRAGWLKDLRVPQKATIHYQQHRNPKRQGEIANEIYRLRYK